MEANRPRVIRRVIKWDRYKKPKIARDSRTQIRLERVVAQVRHCCTYHGCPEDRVILVGEAYAQFTSPRTRRRLGWRDVPDPSDYHFDCVPPEARPLVRFLR